jgi:heme A synthase
MSDPSENDEKAVKMMVENHRIAVALVGLFIAGLFAFAGKGSSALDWRYFVAQLFFVIGGFTILLGVSAAVGQAKEGKYNVNDPAMKVPYSIAIALVFFGLVLAGWFLMSSPAATTSNTPVTGIKIDRDGARISPDTKLKVTIHFDGSGCKVQSIEVSPP